MSSVEEFPQKLAEMRGSSEEKLYQVEEAFNENGTYRIKFYVEGTDELRCIDTYGVYDVLLERKVFRNGHLYSRVIPRPGTKEFLHKTTYREDGSVKSYVEFIGKQVYTTNFDENGDIESVESRDRVKASPKEKDTELKLNLHSIDKIKSTVEWMMTLENSKYATDALEELENIQSEIRCLQASVSKLLNTFQRDEDFNEIYAAAEEVAQCIDLP